MSVTVNSAFEPGARDVRGMNMALTISLVIHALLVLALLLSRDWIAQKPKPQMMITLGGTPGPRSTGMSSMGGKTVEEVAPPPKRLEPAKPPTPKEPDAPVATRTPPPQQKTVTETPKPQAITTRPPVTGPEVQRGSTPVDTSARGQSQGLSFGGGGTGGLTDLRDFCCPEYLVQMQAFIDRAWKKQQSQTGKNIVRFTVLRDGTITAIELEEASGIGILDRASLSALQDTHLPPLPPAYKGDTLTVHITFPYTGN